jgi:PAS domain S-box-containing protein
MGNEARFRLVVEATPSAMVLIRADGLIEMVNSQAERVFGYSRSELLGKPVEMLLPERFRKNHPGLRSVFLNDPHARPMGAGRDLYGLKKCGSEFPIEIGLNPIETEDGVMVLSAIVDITERKQKQMEAAYLAAIVESSDDAIIGKDLMGIVRSWNRGAAGIFGYQANEMIGQSIQLLFPPARLAEEAVIMDGIKRGEHTTHHETVRRRKDGRDIPVSVTVSPIRDAHGAIVGASTILRNISERRNAERALALSEAEFRASFEGAAVGKVLAEPETRRILRANYALARMLGYEPSELVGHMTPEFTWAADRALDALEYASLLAGRSVAHVCEQRYVCRDGTPLWVRVSATLARVPESSQPILAVIAIENIDARHRAQTELLEAKQALEQVVVERTAALDQRNLLLREVYHRVKNNLQIVDGLLMIQAHRIEDPLAKQALLGLRGRIFTLGLVHQQLMGSADLKTFDVGRFLNELSNNLLEGGADATVALSVDAYQLDVDLDFAVPMGLLVTELVTNSMKQVFPDGTGHISVILRPDGDEHVILIVSDNGDAQPGNVTIEQSIAGLGASIVKSLVAQLNGTMTVSDGAGTTTEIRTPMPVQS